MKQKLDELRTLAVRLFNAGQKQRRTKPPEIWGALRNLEFHNLPSESVEYWDAIAFEAMKRGRSRKTITPPPRE